MSGVANKVVLVTGASSGIGEATVRLLAERGARVVFGARRTERIEVITAELRAAGGEVEARPLDVTRLEDVQGFVAFARERFGRVDVLVNNAGVMPLSPLSALKIDEWNRMIDVNIRGVLHGIAATLPMMEAQGSGHIVNVSSIGGHVTYPTSAVYCATKFAVVAITDSLRQETTKVRATTISPGVTESELASTITHEGSIAAMRDFRRVAIPASAVAEAISWAIAQPDAVDVSEIIVRPTASPY
ncbi:MAG: SDR family oxidoreductase [Labilithrix sp.]|nr:SDR family oxidoreductase [Labilithrix sp.]